MGHQHKLRAEILQLPDHLQHLGRHLRIERGGGLVEKQPPRLHDERPQDGDPLLLAAGEFGRTLVGVVGQAKPLQRLPHASPRLGLRQAVHLHERQEQVVHGREMRKQIVGLKDRADRPPIGTQRRFIPRQGHAIEGHGPGHRHVEPRQDSQEC